MKRKFFCIIKAFLIAVFVIFFPVASGVIAGVTEMNTPNVYYLQASFMAIPIVVGILILAFKKGAFSEIIPEGKKTIKDFLYALPVFLVYVPVLFSGLETKDTKSFFGILLLYLFVGIAEELYFRGFMYSLLKKEFSDKWIIFISTFVFGIGHLATAFTGAGALLTSLTVLNALIFGFMAICLLYKMKRLYPLMIFHFLFDFETKFILMEGTSLAIAEAIRGTIMCVYAILLYISLRKEWKMKEEVSE